MARFKAGVPVRGRCGAGHTIEKTAVPGRLTWRGPCPKPGCTWAVVARRIPLAERGPAPPVELGQVA